MLPREALLAKLPKKVDIVKERKKHKVGMLKLFTFPCCSINIIHNLIKFTRRVTLNTLSTCSFRKESDAAQHLNIWADLEARSSAPLVVGRAHTSFDVLKRAKICCPSPLRPS